MCGSSDEYLLFPEISLSFSSQKSQHFYKRPERLLEVLPLLILSGYSGYSLPRYTAYIRLFTLTISV